MVRTYENGCNNSDQRSSSWFSVPSLIRDRGSTDVPQASSLYDVKRRATLTRSLPASTLLPSRLHSLALTRSLALSAHALPDVSLLLLSFSSARALSCSPLTVHRHRSSHSLASLRSAHSTHRFSYSVLLTKCVNVSGVISRSSFIRYMFTLNLKDSRSV